MQDSNIANQGGSGRVDTAKLRKLAEGWGKMPDHERARAIAEVDNLTSGLSPTYREQYREYFRRLAEMETQRK